jgi:sensor histidine kinase regulating citrate/malate metabolism
MLGAATLVLTGVAVLAALLSIWGFATLREHAGTIAKEAAEKAMPKAAEAAAERAVRKLLDLPEGEGSNEIARAYGSENNGN